VNTRSFASTEKASAARSTTRVVQWMAGAGDGDAATPGVEGSGEIRLPDRNTPPISAAMAPPTTSLVALNMSRNLQLMCGR